MGANKLQQGIAVGVGLLVVGTLLITGGVFDSLLGGLGLSQGASVAGLSGDANTEVLYDGGVVIEDTQNGDGDEVMDGSVVTLHYSGEFEDGTVFDDSRQRGEAFTFTVGGGEIIAGFDLGIRGMKAGGSRVLTIAPEFAYGEDGIGPIPGGATLTFTIDLLSVENPSVDDDSSDTETDKEDEA